MYEEMDDFFTEMQRTINDYKEHRNSGSINANKRAARRLLNYKNYIVKYRRYLSFIRTVVTGPNYNYQHTSIKFLRAAWNRGDTKEVNRISKALGINHEDFVGGKFLRVAETKVRSFELTNAEKARFFTGSKYPILLGEPKKLYSHYRNANEREFSLTDRRKDNTWVNHKIYAVKCPDDWEVDDIIAIGKIIETTNGEKYQIHKVVKNTAKYSSKKQPDGSYVKITEASSPDLNTMSFPSYKEGMAKVVLPN
jgi:hypothetical protein